MGLSFPIHKVGITGVNETTLAKPWAQCLACRTRAANTGFMPRPWLTSVLGAHGSRGEGEGPGFAARGCRAFPGPAHLLRALSLTGHVAWVLSVAGCPTGVLTPSCSVAVSLFSSRCRRPSPMWVLTREPGQEVRTSGIVCSSFLKGLPLGGLTQLRGT